MISAGVSARCPKTCLTPWQSPKNLDSPLEVAALKTLKPLILKDCLMPRRRETPDPCFIKLGECVVHLDSIAYISFSESYRGGINKAVIHLRVTEGAIQPSNLSYLRLEKLSFVGEEAQLIHRFFVSSHQTHVLF